MKRALLASALAVAASAAQAQTVRPCGDYDTDVRLLTEPWDQNTRAFANGEVRVALLDMGEPAAIPFKLLILHPPYIEGIARECSVIERGEDFGFADMDFAALEAAYDPAIGLMFALPVKLMLFDDDQTRLAATLRFSLNQATGDIKPGLDVAPQ